MFSVDEKSSQLQLLAEQLKQLCEETVIDGSPRFIETRPKQSASILHKIAMIYSEREQDKISLLKSVGLMNAAAARKPQDIATIESDISNICKRILVLANAKNTSADLIEYIDYAHKIANEINILRKETDKRLKRVIQIHPKTSEKREKEKILQVQVIQEEVTRRYTKVMSELSKYCQDIMGKPPCEFTIAGLGSLARKEITPYSDFEHIILLEEKENNESNLEYFRWFSVIFHATILNLRETIIPSLNIDCLNDNNSSCWFFDAYTTRGIALDGMMSKASVFPLGWKPTVSKPWETELIKPVKDMLTYLTNKPSKETENHLDDVLASPCFVFGNENLFNEFMKGIHLFWNSTDKVATERLKVLFKKDLEKFAFPFSLKEPESDIPKFNLKKVLYRSSTVFMSTVGKVHKFQQFSSFEIIDDLLKSNHISKKTAYKLKYAVAIACEIRLKIYHREGGAKDLLVLADDDSLSKWSILNYFQIAYCLQYELQKLLNLNDEHYNGIESQKLNIKFHRMTGFHKEAEKLEKLLQETPFVFEQENIDFDSRLEAMVNRYRFAR